jgi:hypothetical protein
MQIARKNIPLVHQNTGEKNKQDTDTIDLPYPVAPGDGMTVGNN